MFDFINLDLQENTKQFIDKGTHPQPGQDLPHNVHIRDPETVVNKWKTKLKWKEVDNIQQKCKEAMNLWGYIPLKNKNDKSSRTYSTDFQLY